MTSTFRLTGAAIAWTLLTTGCPAADNDDGTTSPASTETDATTTDAPTETQTESESDSMTSANPTTSESDSDTAPTMCNGGAACAEGEYCSNGSESCDCDANYDYCDLTSTPAGCYPVPQPCAVLMDPDRETCIADFECNISGEFVDGVLECERYEECSGDCDYELCEDTSSTTAAESGSSDSGSSGGDSSTTG